MDTREVAKEIQNLVNISYSELYRRRVKIRAMVINMHLNKANNVFIAKTLCISVKSVAKYIKIYKENGIEGLIKENPYRPKSELENHADKIVESLKNNPCATINECCDRIEKITGIKRSPTQVATFIKKKI